MSSTPLLALVAILLLGPALARPAPGDPSAPAPAQPASQAQAPAEAGDPALSFTGDKFPPVGTPEDVALLRSLLVTQGAVISERMGAIRLMQRLGATHPEDQLAAAAKTLPAEQAARALQARARLIAAWNGTRELLLATWPVDPRLGCREQGVQLEVVMPSGVGQPASARLQMARDRARSCLARQEVALLPFQKASRELQAAAAEAQALLPGSPAGAIPGGPPAPPPTGGPANASATPAPNGN